MTNIKVNAEMKMQEVRAIAKQVGVKFRAGMTKLDLIALIEEAIDFERAESTIQLEEVIEAEVVENEEMMAVEASMDEVVIEEVKEEEVGSVTTEEQELHWYEMLQRPVGLGCQPKNFFSFENDKGKWGIVSYTLPLTEEDMESYEMGVWEPNKEAAKEVATEKAPKKAPVKKEQEGINLFFGGIKDSEEAHHEMLYKKIGELKEELEATFKDIEYLTSWIMGVKEKNGQRVLAIKLKHVFNNEHLEVVEKHGFELNRAHFYTYLPLPEVKEEKKPKYKLNKGNQFAEVRMAQ